MTDQTNLPSANVIARIQKLLALADQARNASEAEATAAAAKAMELIQAHGLSLAELESEGATSDDGGPREKRTIDRRAMYGWQVRLMAQVAEVNFCLHRVRKVRDEVTGRPGSRKHQLVGRQINVEAATMVYDYLIEAMRRLSAAEKIDGRGADFHAWHEGFADRVAERLEERADAARAESEAKAEAARAAAAGTGNGRALVLADVYGSENDLNNDAMWGFALGTTATKRRETQERMKRQEAEMERLEAEGVEHIEAWYRAHGYGEDAAAVEAKRYHRNRRRRAGRGFRGGGWTKADERRDSASYRKGAAAGAAVGLDPQVDRASRKQIGGGK